MGTIEMQKLERPSAVLVLVGCHPTAMAYANATSAAARACDIVLRLVVLAETATECEVRATIDELNADASVSGVVLQLPLPAHLDAMGLVELVDVSKDVDGLCEASITQFCAAGEAAAVTPCIALAAEQLLSETKRLPRSAEMTHVLLLGVPALLSWPLELAFEAKGCAVSIVAGDDVQTARAEMPHAHVLLTGEVAAGLVTSQWVRDDCVILELGLGRHRDRPPSAPASPTSPAASPAWRPAEAPMRDVVCLCASDGLAAMVGAFRMRNAAQLALIQQGFFGTARPHEERPWPFQSTRGAAADPDGDVAMASDALIGEVISGPPSAGRSPMRRPASMGTRVCNHGGRTGAAPRTLHYGR